MTHLLRPLAALLLAATTGCSSPGDDSRLEGAALVEALQGGGHVLLLRHTETAELAFGRAEPERALLSLASVGEDGSTEQEQALDAARELAGQAPEAGTNAWLVGHVSTFMPLTGANTPEGGTVVLRPDGEGGFAVAAQVPAGGWQELAAQQ